MCCARCCAKRRFALPEAAPPQVRLHCYRFNPVKPSQPRKIARILDQEDDAFSLEYDNTIGKKNTMRLDAFTYENAIREARSFLGINADDRDADGTEWDIE
jgi:hypothetical protein